MFYTFIVLFEKSSTLIDLMDLCKDFIVKEESVTNLALTGWGCYNEFPCNLYHWFILSLLVIFIASSL
jgi:hypothetical protein